MSGLTERLVRFPFAAHHLSPLGPLLTRIHLSIHTLNYISPIPPAIASLPFPIESQPAGGFVVERLEHDDS